MPITDEMRQLIMRNGNALDIAEQAQTRRRARPAPVGPAQGQDRAHVARGNRGRHQRVAREHATWTAMATATAAPRKDVKEYTFLVGRHRPQQPAGARRDRAPRRRRVVTTQPAPPGHPRHQDQEASRSAAARKVSEKDITFFTRQLATMLKAGVPLLQAFDIVARGHSNAALLAADDGHQDRGRDGLEPVAGVPRVPGALRRALLQPGAAPAKRPACSTRILDRLATYKEKILAIKGKIKSRAVLPDLGHRGRDRRRLRSS